MQTSLEFLTAIRARYPEKTHSDYATAKLLGFSRSAMSLHKMGRVHAFSDETGLRIAELLDLKPGYVMACLASERAKRPDVALAWKKVAGGLFALYISHFFAWDGTATAQATTKTTCGVIHYAKSRRLLAALLGAFLGLFGGAALAADPWSTGDKVREGVYLTLLAADWGQTLDIENHDGYKEGNPFLGPDPSRSRITTWVLSTALVHVAAVHVLPARWRPIFQYLSIGIEANMVNHNASMGLRLAF